MPTVTRAATATGGAGVTVESVTGTVTAVGTVKSATARGGELTHDTSTTNNNNNGAKSENKNKIEEKNEKAAAVAESRKEEMEAKGLQNVLVRRS